MHLYYHQGVMAWELAYVWSAFKAAAPAVTLEMLASAARASNWQFPRRLGRAQGFAARLFNPKLWDDDCFKGIAEDAAAVMPLLRYFLWQLCQPRGLLVAEMNSFECLCKIHCELRRLKHKNTPLCDEDLGLLRELEEQHHSKFLTAYSAEKMKPKHHHRFHLTAGCLLLGMLPDCHVHEKKHQIYKTSLCDRYEGQLGHSRLFARRCLTNMLLETLQQLKETGLPCWELHGVQKPASPGMRAALRCQLLKTAPTARIGKSEYHAGDILVFSEDRAVVLLECFTDGMHIWLLGSKLQALSKHPWGQKWLSTDGKLLWEASLETELLLPQWWRWEGDAVVTLR